MARDAARAASRAVGLAVLLSRLVAAGLIALILTLRVTGLITTLVPTLFARPLPRHLLVFPRRIWHETSPFVPYSGQSGVGGCFQRKNSNRRASRRDMPLRVVETCLGVTTARLNRLALYQ